MTTREATTETSATGSSIRVGFRTGSVAASRLRFIRQVGATDVFIDGDVIPTTKQPDEAEARIEVVKQLLRNLGAANIPILGYPPERDSVTCHDTRLVSSARCIPGL